MYIRARATSGARENQDSPLDERKSKKRIERKGIQAS